MTDLANGPMDEQDAEILAGIAGLFDAIDPPDPQLADEIVFALSLAALDAELATLQEASELSVRAHSSTDTVTFSSSAVQLMVSTSEDGDDCLRVDGWVTGGGVTVELVRGVSSTPAVSDAHGRLVWRDVPRGPVRFLIHPSAQGARPVLTPVIEF